MKSLFSGASLFAIIVAGTAAHAADATATTTADTGASAVVEEVIVTGTRQSGVKAVDSAAPIQVVGSGALKRVGQPDLIQALSQNLPSFNAAGYGADTAQLTLSAALRGLSPNDTLILVDGKRRHTTGNLAVDSGSPYTGAATTDLTFIPVGAIDHVEVLQDGAAAQYGSDAIAGVVNIILKNADHGGSITGTGGAYYDGGGATGAWSFNGGAPLGSKGFVNLTVEEKYHAFSQQGGCDARFYTPSCTLLSGLTPEDEAGVPGATNAPRVNHIYGDPTYNVYDGFLNAGYDLGDNVQLYAFGSYGHRIAQSYENYRKPSIVASDNSLGMLEVPFPNGFNPKEALSEDDFSITGGVKGVASGWNWDLSTTYGRDKDNISTLDSANPSLWAILQAASPTLITPQTNFYDGSFTNSEWTGNLDISRDFNLGLASPLNVAFGGEARKDTFAIAAGEPNSTLDGGEQSYPGFAEADAGSHPRTNYAAYIDFAVDPITGLKVDLAGRYEHYSDFGSDEVGKLTARYDFNPMFAIRGTVSTGFRAPTLAEEYYSSTNVGPTFGYVQLPPNSPAAAATGFSPLKPEKSDNYSVGFVAHPADRLQITGDVYEIDIRDRIINSNPLIGLENGVVVSQGIYTATLNHGGIPPGVSYVGIQIFNNGANTRTRGAEVTLNYSSDFGDMGHVDWTAGFNYNETTVTKILALPAAVYSPPINSVLLGPNALTALTDSTPKEKLVLGAYWTLGKWGVNLRDTVYGPSSQLVSLDGTGNSYPGNPATDLKIPVTSITDLDISYKITPALILAVGANNLFDHRPPTVPTIMNPNTGAMQPADGNHVYGEPDQFSPFGINGGYYYGRVTYNF
jgi:iron complex outermembrane receptor protein